MHQVKVDNNKHAQPTEFPQHRVEKPQSKFHLWGKSEPHLLGASPQQCAGVIWASNVSVSMSGKSGAESKVSEVRAEITCWEQTDLFGCWGKSSASLKRLVNNSLSRKPLTFFGIAKCLNFISIYLEMLQQGSDPHPGLLQCSPPFPPCDLLSWCTSVRWPRSCVLDGPTISSKTGMLSLIITTRRVLPTRLFLVLWFMHTGSGGISRVFDLLSG